MSTQRGEPERGKEFKVEPCQRYLPIVLEYLFEIIVFTAGFYAQHGKLFKEYQLGGIREDRELFDPEELENARFLAALITSADKTEGQSTLCGLLKHLKEGRINRVNLKKLADRLSHRDISGQSDPLSARRLKGLTSLLAVFGWNIQGSPPDAIAEELKMPEQTVKNLGTQIFDALIPDTKKIEPEKRLVLLQKVASDEGFIVKRS